MILFFGGWNSGVPAASSGTSVATWTGALIGFVALQLKVAAVIVALMWLYRKHLEAGPSRFLRLAHKMAIPFGLLNIVVTGFAFPFFDRSALVAKAAVAWGVLLIAGMVFNLLSRRQGNHS